MQEKPPPLLSFPLLGDPQSDSSRNNENANLNNVVDESSKKRALTMQDIEGDVASLNRGAAAELSHNFDIDRKETPYSSPLDQQQQLRRKPQRYYPRLKDVRGADNRYKDANSNLNASKIGGSGRDIGGSAQVESSANLTREEWDEMMEVAFSKGEGRKLMPPFGFINTVDGSVQINLNAHGSNDGGDVGLVLPDNVKHQQEAADWLREWKRTTNQKADLPGVTMAMEGTKIETTAPAIDWTDEKALKGLK